MLLRHRGRRPASSASSPRRTRRSTATCRARTPPRRYDAANILLNGILEGNTDRASLLELRRGPHGRRRRHLQGGRRSRRTATSRRRASSSSRSRTEAIVLRPPPTTCRSPVPVRADEGAPGRAPPRFVHEGDHPSSIDFAALGDQFWPQTVDGLTLGLDLRPHRARLHARLRRAAPHQLRPLRDLHPRHLRHHLRHPRAGHRRAPGAACALVGTLAGPARRGDGRLGARRGPDGADRLPAPPPAQRPAPHRADHRHRHLAVAPGAPRRCATAATSIGSQRVLEKTTLFTFQGAQIRTDKVLVFVAALVLMVAPRPVREPQPARPRHPGHRPGRRDGAAHGRQHRPGGARSPSCSAASSPAPPASSSASSSRPPASTSASCPASRRSPPPCSAASATSAARCVGGLLLGLLENYGSHRLRR